MLLKVGSEFPIQGHWQFPGVSISLPISTFIELGERASRHQYCTVQHRVWSKLSPSLYIHKLLQLVYDLSIRKSVDNNSLPCFQEFLWRLVCYTKHLRAPVLVRPWCYGGWLKCSAWVSKNTAARHSFTNIGTLVKISNLFSPTLHTLMGLTEMFCCAGFLHKFLLV